jgi:outer membrane protein OmpA-like peptidoglycan-associated protein
MRKLLFASAAVVLAAALSSAAQAQDWTGPEIGIQGGYGWGTSSGDVNAPLIPYSFSPSGGLGGVHAGYNWQFGQIVLGLEGDVEGGDLSKSAIVDTFGDVIHSRLDFDASVRGKLGFAFNRVLFYGTGGVEFGDVRTTYLASGVFNSGSIGGIRTGWTVGGGLAFAVTPNWELSAEYRYADLGHKDIANTFVVDSNEFSYNVIRVGLTYRFAPPPPPPPPMAAPMPAAAPAAAPPPPPRTFLVFFDFDRYNLTAEARQIIEAAADTYKKTGVARIEVSGYTDLAGTQAYNLRLSQRRADAVAAYLAHLGVPRNVMDVKWFGKEHPRVPTPDGVREPQNRRVEIVMP